MRLALLLALLAWVGRSFSADVTYCVVTARRPVSYVSDLVSGLETQGADFLVVDVDNSTDWAVPNVLTPPRVTRECIVGYVGCPVQQQALDVLGALEACAGHSGSDWVILVEDDMLPCSGSVQAIADALDSDGDRYKWGRFAKFSRAVAFPVGSIDPYKRFVLDNLSSIPYDQALTRDWGEGPTYQHDRSLFSHQGSVSTIGERNDPAFVQAYSDLRGESCGDLLV